MHQTAFRLAIIAAILARAHAAFAQCDDWRAGPLNPTLLDINGPIRAVTLWDPDGAGPLPTMLIIGGDFTVLDGIPASHVAAWDGQHWQPLGAGTDDIVESLGTFNGDLIVGGHFQNAGGIAANNIARLTGGLSGTWHALTTGLGNDSLGEFHVDVQALAVYGGQLYAGGTFFWVGNQIMQGISRWNGTSWNIVGSGLQQYHPGAYYQVVVTALTVYNGDLIATGGFSFAGEQSNNRSIGRWDGANWHDLGAGLLGPSDPGFNNQPYGWPGNALAIFNNELIVGGLIGSAGGVPVHNVAAWNGTGWHALGTGIGQPLALNQPYEFPSSLFVFQNQLIAGGYFSTAGGSPVNSLAAWNGSQWSSYLGGVTDASTDESPTVECMTGYSGGLIAAGLFDHAGGVFADNIVSGNGTAWSPLRAPGVPNVAAFSSVNGRVVAAGAFAAVDTNSNLTQNIASWDGQFVYSFGTGLNAPAHALKTFTTGLPINLTYHMVAGGEFLTAGGITVNHIAQWNENSISFNPPPAWSVMGPGLNDTVFAVERFNNLTIAAGQFLSTSDNATSLNRIGAWNGTNWQPLAGGLNNPCYALKVYNGALYAGGSFSFANGSVHTGGLARWNGSNWTAVVGTFVGTVYSLEVYNGDLIIGGVYPGISGSPNIARYNSSSNTYSVLGSGGTDGAVRSLLSESGNLYMGGDFTHAGGIAASHLARWNGSAWSTVGGGADDSVYAMIGYHDEVHAGGAFANVRTGVINTPAWARFLETGAPWLVHQPLPTSAVCNGNASFSATVATGYGGLNFQWRHDGLPLDDGFTGTGSNIGHAHGVPLDVEHVSDADAGNYDLVVSNGCGSVTSISAALTVSGGTGNGDGNGDGAVDGQDIAGFVNMLLTGVSQGRGVCAYDMNSDGVVNTADLPLFVARLLAH